MTSHPSRKLVVILHADVVSSTGLVQRNESVAHERIRDAFRRFSATIESYGGIAHEIRGDALVAEFARASDAVSAALVFQAANAAHNSGLTGDIRPEIRVGSSLGEVIIADGTITGAGVVLAQRLEQLAQPGGVVVQGAVAETVPTRMPFEFEDLGAQELKGFDQPVRASNVYLRAGETVPSPECEGMPGVDSHPIEETASHPAFDLPDKPSIAVLPFNNMSGDPEQEYFADGLTEDIITEISKIDALFVISRNSTFTYKGKATKTQDICHDLGVRHVVEGSVRKAGERVRVTAQLIDGQSSGHIWAERFDRALVDIFAVQDEITEQIVRALEVNLVDNARARLTRVETVVPEAYDCFLRGREQFRLFSKDGNVAAHQLFERAIGLNPNYAAAYAGLALTCLHEWFLGSREALDRGFQLALRANALDPSLPLVYEALGNVYLFKKHHDAALDAARRWVALEPNNADGYANLAGALQFSGEPEKVNPLIDKAMRLNPFYPFYYILYRGLAYMTMDRYEEALEVFKRSVAHNPESLHAHLYVAACFGLLGKNAPAREALAEVHRIYPEFSLAWVQAFIPYKRPADLEQLIDGLRKAGLHRY